MKKKSGPIVKQGEPVWKRGGSEEKRGGRGNADRSPRSSRGDMRLSRSRGMSYSLGSNLGSYITPLPLPSNLEPLTSYRGSGYNSFQNAPPACNVSFNNFGGYQQRLGFYFFLTLNKASIILPKDR